MSSLTDYLDGDSTVSFDEFLDGSDINTEDTFDEYDQEELTEEEKANIFKASVAKARNAYEAAIKNAKEAYSKAVGNATSAYVKASDGVKSAYNKGRSEVKTTVDDIKKNKELVIKVAVASAVATAAVIGVACLICKKKK